MTKNRINPTTDLLLTKDEARSIQHALCAMNVIGAPLFQTAIVRRYHWRAINEVIVFTWQETEDDLCQVMIYESYATADGQICLTPNPVRVKDAKIEQHDDQNAFFRNYGLED